MCMASPFFNPPSPLYFLGPAKVVKKEPIGKFNFLFTTIRCMYTHTDTLTLTRTCILQLF